MPQNVQMSNIIEDCIDFKDAHTYVKCMCGEEILEFNCFHDNDETGKDLFKYSLVYHGQLDKKILNTGYNDFVFNGKKNVEVFLTILKNIIDKNDTDCYSICDAQLPSNCVKKYGLGVLEIYCDGCTIDFRKWVGEKFYNKAKKKTKNKYSKCAWEICLTKDMVSKFAENIINILKDKEE